MRKVSVLPSSFCMRESCSCLANAVVVVLAADSAPVCCHAVSEGDAYHVFKPAVVKLYAGPYGTYFYKPPTDSGKLSVSYIGSAQASSSLERLHRYSARVRSYPMGTTG